MAGLVGQRGEMFLGADEKLARGQGDAIRDRAVERLRSGVLNLGRVGHSGDDSLSRLDWIVLMRLDIRQFIEDGLRKLALLKIEEPIVSKDETPARLLVGLVLLGVTLAVSIRDLIDLPKHHDLAVLALTHRSAELVRLLHGQQRGETYFVAESRNRLTPRYGFFDTRLRGIPVALQGRRSGSRRALRLCRPLR